MFKRFFIPALLLIALVPFCGVIQDALATPPSWDPAGAGFQGLPDNDDDSARFMVLSGPANNSLVGTENGPGETFVQLVFTPASDSDPIRVGIFDANGIGVWDQRAFGIFLNKAPNIRYRLYADPAGDALSLLQDGVAANDPSALVTTNSETDYDPDATTDNAWVSFFDQPASAVPAAQSANGSYRFLMRISMTPAAGSFALQGPERAGHKIAFNGTYILPGGTVFGFAGGAVDERTIVGTENQAIHDTRDPNTYLTKSSAPVPVQNAGTPYLFNGVFDFHFRSSNACEDDLVFSEADADYQTPTTAGQTKANPLVEPALVGIPPDNVPYYLRPGDTFNFRDVSAFLITDDIGNGPRPVRWSIYPVADITTPPDGANTPAAPQFTDVANAPSNHASITAAKQAGTFQASTMPKEDILANPGFYRVRWESVDISNFVFMKFNVDVGTTPVAPRASGRIFCDANDNGVYDDGTDMPWSGGAVNLSVQRIDCQSKAPVGAPIPVVTNAAGEWTLQGLLEGCYTLDVTDTISFSLSTGVTLPIEFELDGDDCDKQVDIGYQCTQSICGELFCDDNGDCIFNGNDGVLPAGASATIVVTPIDPVSKDAIGPAITKVLDGTDSHEWCVDGLAFGTYLITVDSTLNIVDSPCAVESYERTLSADTTGQIDDVIFPLVCLEQICGRIYCDDDLSEDYTAGDDRELEGVQVEARPKGEPTADPITATTDEDGNYCLPVPPGEWVVMVPMPQVPALDGVSPATGQLLSIEVDARNGSIDDIDFRFDCSSTISGRVFCEGPNEDCDGEYDLNVDDALEGIVLELVRNGSVVAETTTIADGTYIFSGVAPSKAFPYTVRVKAGQAALAGKIGPAPENYTDIEVPNAGELTSTITGLDFAYCLLEVSGRVFCEGGPGGDCDGDYDAGTDQPLAGIDVILKKDGVQVGQPAQTNSEGMYTFNILEVADYTVEVVPGQPELEGKLGPTPTFWDAKFTEQTGGNRSIRDLDFAYCRTTVAISGKIWCERPTIGNGAGAVSPCNNTYDPTATVGEAGGDTDSLLAGIEVELISNNVVVDTATTAGNGRYIFDDLATGTDYTVRVKAGQAALASKVGPAPEDIDVSVPLDVSDFSSDDNDFVVCQLWICPLAWCDVDGSGLREATATYTEPVLNLAWEIRPQGQPNADPVLRGTSCDWIDAPFTAPNPAEGVDVPPGAWTLTIISPTGENAPTPAAGTTFDFVVDESSTFPYLPHFPYDCVLTVKGRFWCDGGSPGCDGVFQPENDTPLAGMQVRLEQIDGTNVVNGQTNGAGEYTLSTKIPGTYRVRLIDADLPGKTGAYHNGVLVTGPIGSFSANGGSRTYEDIDFYYCPEPGRLTGLVFEESHERPCDGELQQDEEANGLAGVTVTITGPLNASINTNQNGIYVFNNLPAGDYNVTVDGQDMGTFGVSPSSATSVPALITPGGTTTVNFAGCRPAKIEGYVFKDPVGDCDGEYANGEGLENWQVDLIQNGAVVASETTDAFGKYEFGDLDAGDYTVELQITEPTAGDNCYLVSPADKQVDVSLLPGETERVDYGLCAQALAGRVWSEVFEQLNGVWEPTEDTPLAGVSVSIEGVSGDALGYTDETTTDAQGKYRFDNLPTGQYEIVVTDNAGNQTILSGLEAQDPTLRDPSLAPGDFVDDQDFYYTSTMQAVSGRVWKETFGGTNGVWEPTEDTPLANVEVEITGVTGDAVGYNDTTTTDNQGFYSFDDIPAGSYLIKITDSAGNVTIVEGLTGPTPDERTPSVGVNETVPNQDFYYVDPTQSLSGRVWQEVFEDLNGIWEPTEDTPLAGVNVTIEGTSGDALGQTFDTNTNADGFYQFDNIPTGTYDVYVTDNAGNQAILGELIAQDPTLRQPTVNPGDNIVEQDFYYTGTMQTLCGRVWQEDYAELNSIWDPDNENDTPLAGVEVSITGIAGDADGYSDTMLTGDDGRYCFQGIPAGTYRVVVTDSAGNETILGTLDAVPPTERTPDVPLNGNVDDQDFVYTTTDQKLCGRVWQEDYTNTDGVWNPADDTGLVGVEVSIEGVDGPATGYTDTTFTYGEGTPDVGMYNFEGIPAGTYIVKITDSAGNVTITEGLVGPTPDQRTPDVPVNGAAHDQDFYYVNQPVGCDDTQDICLKIFGEPMDACDGVFDDGVDMPLGGVEVFVRAQGQTDGYIASGFTDANGEYCFMGLEPGMYEVYPGGNQEILAGYEVFSDGRDCRPVELKCGEDVYEAFGFCPTCSEPSCCEGYLQQLCFESEHCAWDLEPGDLITVRATLYDGDAVIDTVELAYEDAFPGAATGLDGVLRIDHVTVHPWGSAIVKVCAMADADSFPMGHFGGTNYRVEVSFNKDTAAGHTRFMCEDVRPGSLFTYSEACGDMPPCDIVVEDPYQWLAQCLPECEARFLVLKTLSYDGWKKCNGEDPEQSLSGRVWWELEADENGVWESDADNPFEGLAVELVGTSGDAAGYSETTTTSTDGTYAFMDIPTGAYTVMVKDSDGNDIILSGYDARDPTSYGPTVNDGDNVTDRDFYYVEPACKIDFGPEVFTYTYRVPCEYSQGDVHHVELKLLLGETDNIIDRVATEWEGECFKGELDSRFGNLTLLEACKVGVDGDDCLYEVTFRVNRDCDCDSVDTDGDGEIDRWTDARLCTTVDWVFSDDDEMVRLCPDINMEHVPNDV